MASAAVGIVQSIAQIGIQALAQHTARLKNATSENQALDSVIPAFDADLAAIAQAFSTGAANASTCIQALLTVDANIFNYLYALTQQKLPGIAWGGPTTGEIGTGNEPIYSADCNKSCTASCCVYLNDLRPSVFGRGGLGSAYQPYQTNGVILGMIELIQRGGGTLKAIPVAKPTNSAYGTYSRSAYTLTLTTPPVQSSIQQTISEMTGGSSTLALPDGTVIQPVSAGNPVASPSSSILGASIGGTSALSLPLLIVVGIGLLLFALLLGGRR